MLMRVVEHGHENGTEMARRAGGRDREMKRWEEKRRERGGIKMRKKRKVERDGKEMEGPRQKRMKGREKMSGKEEWAEG